MDKFEFIRIDDLFNFESSKVSSMNVLENGNFIISYCILSEEIENEILYPIIIYNPKEKQIKKKINFDRCISQIKYVNRKIAVECFPRNQNKRFIVIMDENLNYISDKEITGFILVTATESFLLVAPFPDCIQGVWMLNYLDRDILVGYDWNLDLIDDEIVEKYFTIATKLHMTFFIKQFEKVNDNYVVRCSSLKDEDRIVIFDNDCKEIVRFETQKKFIIDVQGNVILYDFKEKNSLEFYDLKGVFVKEQVFDTIFEKFRFMVIDSNGAYYCIFR